MTKGPCIFPQSNFHDKKKFQNTKKAVVSSFFVLQKRYGFQVFALKGVVMGVPNVLSSGVEEFGS